MSIMQGSLIKNNNGGHRIIVSMILCLFVLCPIVAQKKELLMKQEQREQIKPVQKELKTPLQREQNTADSDDSSKRVFLDHADVLFFDQRTNPDAQILDGNVAFTHNGAQLFCDSAHFYEKTNSFEAFGNVKMYQGDSISLFGDYAHYDGNEMMAMVRYNVVLEHRNGSTLYTDSLNYDRLYNVGYFFNGGRLEDKNSTLMSDWGEYNANTKMALFNFDVVLTDEDFVMKGDTLYYDTNTSWAHAVGPSVITSGTSIINTIDGFYNTQTDSAMLFKRSKLTDKGKTMIGDTIRYNAKTGVGEGFMNVVYTDDQSKNGLLCNYFRYEELTGNGLANDSAIAMDYSERDTLFLHADTFKIYTFNINTDSVYRKVHAYNHVRAYRVDVQAVCDSLVFDSRDSCMTMYRDPITWANNMQLLGEEIKVYMKDSTINRAEVIRQALSVERLPDTIHYNQVSADMMTAYFKNGDICQTDADGNVLIVYYPVEESDSSLLGLNYTETTQLKMYIENRKMQKIWMPKAEGVMYPMTQIPPDKYFLPNYAWFDYVRPRNKQDIFNWRGKKAGTELKEQKRREAPLQHLK